MATITGTDNSDILRGTSGADQLYGGAGNDTLYVDAADTVINGGTGTDIVIMLEAAALSLDLGANSVEWVYGNAGADHLDASTLGQGAVIYGGAGDDIITGSSYNDDLRGDAGNDTIRGGIGNDVIFGGAGADRLYGGDGDDTLFIDHADTVVDGGTGYDSVLIQEALVGFRGDEKPLAW
jgi:Ca2+-binding RTX toxin-like protein